MSKKNTKTVLVKLRIEPTLKRDFNSVCEANLTTMSAQARILIKKYVEEQKDKIDPSGGEFAPEKAQGSNMQQDMFDSDTDAS